jgi:hypothetical protein
MVDWLMNFTDFEWKKNLQNTQDTRSTYYGVGCYSKHAIEAKDFFKLNVQNIIK